MTLTNFRIAAWTLIVFNVVGTVATWTAHLDTPGTGNAHAIANGTNFTGPVVFVAVWIAVVLLTMVRGFARTIAIILMTLFALGFGFGEVTEFFQSNHGLGSGRWNIVLAASGVGLAIAAV
ncbi:MAG TPA: hypothetical protein VNG12_15590, partial [Acidimicrobiales bacterium]|nr:hypothetical protein [Acidimicrobiales bacterium]